MVILLWFHFWCWWFVLVRFKFESLDWMKIVNWGEFSGEKSGGWGEECSWVAGETCLPKIELKSSPKNVEVEQRISFIWISQMFWLQALKESVSDIRGTLEGSSLKVFTFTLFNVCQLLSLLPLLETDQWFLRCFKTVLRCTCNTSSRDSGWWWLKMTIFLMATVGNDRNHNNLNYQPLLLFSMMGNLTKFMEQPSLSLQN